MNLKGQSKHNVRASFTIALRHGPILGECIAGHIERSLVSCSTSRHTVYRPFEELSCRLGRSTAARATLCIRQKSEGKAEPRGKLVLERYLTGRKFMSG